MCAEKNSVVCIVNGNVFFLNGNTTSEKIAVAEGLIMVKNKVNYMKKIFAFLFVMINVALFAQNPVSVDEIGGFKNYKLGQQLRVDKSVKRTKVDGDYSIYQIVDSSILTYLGYKIFYATVECVNVKIVRLKLTFIFSDYHKLGDFSVDVIRLLGKYNSLGVHPSDNPDLTLSLIHI